MNIDGSIKNLLQGVSQQHPTKRIDGQCTRMENMLPDAVDGLKRRAPTYYDSVLQGVPVGAHKWHDYNDGADSYTLAITATGAVYVFDSTGTPQTVEVYAETSGLAFTVPADLSIVTIGDYTLIANKNTKPAFTDDTEAYTETALIYLRDGGEYGRTYTVTIGGVLCAKYVTPGGSNPAVDSKQTGTEYVAQQLYLQLSNGGVGTWHPEVYVPAVEHPAVYDTSEPPVLIAAGWTDPGYIIPGYYTYEAVALLEDYTFAVAGSIIEVTYSGGAVVDLDVTDDRGGQFAKIIQRSVKKPGDLPKFATPGHIVQVTGDGTSDKDDFYLKFIVEQGTVAFGTEGVWRECSEPGVLKELDAATMPQALIHLPDSTWLVTPLDGHTWTSGELSYTVEQWVKRASGSSKSNPDPMFIGSSIDYLFSVQDRLGILTGEHAVTSATSSYFNFFNKTALTILDSDPCTMPSSGDTRAYLRSAVQHDKNLVFFSDNAQFIVPGTKEITPKSSMIKSTSFEAQLNAKPISAGASILFPISYGDYSGIREFNTNLGSDTNSSQPITAHVPKYIKGVITQLAASSNFDLVVCRATGEPNSLAVYKYTIQDGVKAQSAWGKWFFNCEAIEHCYFVDSILYLIMRVGDNYTQEHIDLTDAPFEDLPCNIYIDSQVELTPVAGVVELPYTATKEQLVVVAGAGNDLPGASCIVTSVDTNNVTLAEQPAGKVVCGVRFTSLYEPTTPFMKDTSGHVISTVRLVLSKLFISCTLTGRFITTIINRHYKDYVSVFSGLVFGKSKLGEAAITSAVHTVVARKDAAETTAVISTDSYLPMTLTSIEWSGDYTKRGRRVT